MPDESGSKTPDGQVTRTPNPATPSPSVTCGDDEMLCERCGKAAMYRMHAVWRCPACGYKTDCCGW
jgi:hypothetical protein